MELSRCSALFLTALFSLYRCRFKERGSCDIFPTQWFAFDRSSGDIDLPQRFILAWGSDDIVLELFLCSLLTFNISSRFWRYSA